MFMLYFRVKLESFLYKKDTSYISLNLYLYIQFFINCLQNLTLK